MHPHTFFATVLLASAVAVLTSPVQGSIQVQKRGNKQQQAQVQAKVSSDGSCGRVRGAAVTCKGSRFGECCAKQGVCGGDAAQCGVGCQSAFGFCSQTNSSSRANSPTPAIPAGKAQKICDKKSANVVTNPSFEANTDSWVLTGGAAFKTNGDDQTTWGFLPTDGRKYISLESTPQNATSSLTQTIRSISGDTVTVAFDWAFMVVSTDSGPPSTSCTLATTLGEGDFYTVASWTRPGASGGSGRTCATLSTGIGAGDLTFSFSCTSTTYAAGVMIDNVMLRACQANDWRG